MPVVAYADFLRFGMLPHAGGTFDQPEPLMTELRIVHGAYRIERDRLERKRQKAASRGKRR